MTEISFAKTLPTLKVLADKLPASWKGYLVAAAAGYFGSNYGPAAKATISCLASAFGASK